MTYTIIDVREPSEFVSNHVVGALNIPLSQLTQDHLQLISLAKDTNIIVYCQSGGRSSRAISILEGLGYSQLTNGINQQHVEASI